VSGVVAAAIALADPEQVVVGGPGGRDPRVIEALTESLADSALCAGRGRGVWGCERGRGRPARSYGVVVTAVAVRTAVAADLDAIREVFRVASLSNAGDRAALLADPEILIWPGTAITEGWTRVAVADDGAIVGFATAVPVGGALELEDLFVEPGRMRQGVARRLIEDVLSLAAKSGIRTVQVTANPHAMAFYTAVGFVPDGTTQTLFGPAPRLRLDVVDTRR
jgi:GNAT superfamily N-acetyltransferase